MYDTTQIFDVCRHMDESHDYKVERKKKIADECI